MKVVAVMLAAGESRRMGHSKALLEHEGGKSFLQSLSSTFGKAGCSVLAVLGKDAETVRENHPSVHVVENPRWSDSLFSSVKVGLDAALEEGADVVLLHPVDMPAVRATTLKALIKGLGESGEGLRPEFEGAPGFPLLLSRASAERLRETTGETQLEGAVRALNLRRVSVKDPGVIVNINTPQNDERLFGSAPKLAPPPKRRGKKAEATQEPAPAAPLDPSEGLPGT
ncbi:MAG: nucleotidyltransferase family protein [Cystobacter sp.]